MSIRTSRELATCVKKGHWKQNIPQKIRKTEENMKRFEGNYYSCSKKVHNLPIVGTKKKMQANGPRTAGTRAKVGEL